MPDRSNIILGPVVRVLLGRRKMRARRLATDGQTWAGGLRLVGGEFASVRERLMGTSQEEQDYQNRIVVAVMSAIFEASTTDVDGEPAAYVATTDVCEALITVIASLMEGAPNCQTPKGARELSDAVARKIRTRIMEIRTSYERTGRRPPSVTISG